MCEDRVSKWPNTLAALRIKREQQRAERERVEEEARRVGDKQEADRRALERKKKIDAANDLIFSQTDKMKVLRGKMLLDAVLKDR